MDWSNERYVRIYVRDTKTWLKLGWEGQTVFMHMSRKCDRSGILDDIDEPAEDLALITGLPVEICKTGIERLLKRGTVEWREDMLFIPNFMDAQEASKSNAQRQREFREKRKAEATSKRITERYGTETECDKMSQPETSGNEVSQGVTPTCADPVLPCADPVLPCAKEKSKPKKKVADYPPDFVLFWEAYPNRTGKGAAVKAWKSALKSGLLPPADKLIEILGEQVSSREHNASVGVFVPPWPNPSTWLNQRRWEDEPSAAAQSPKPAYKPIQYDY